MANIVRSASAPTDCWPHNQTYSFSTLVLVSGYERVSKPLPIPAHASSSFLCWLQVRWWSNGKRRLYFDQMSKCRTCIAAVQHYLTHYASILPTRLLRLVTASFRCWGFFFLALEQAEIRTMWPQKKRPLHYNGTAEVFRQGGTRTCSYEGKWEEVCWWWQPSLLSFSLAAKPSYSLRMILLAVDSITFSTGRYGFDKNLFKDWND